MLRVPGLIALKKRSSDRWIVSQHTNTNIKWSLADLEDAVSRHRSLCLLYPGITPSVCCIQASFPLSAASRHPSFPLLVKDDILCSQQFRHVFCSFQSKQNPCYFLSRSSWDRYKQKYRKAWESDSNFSGKAYFEMFLFSCVSPHLFPFHSVIIY